MTRTTEYTVEYLRTEHRGIMRQIKQQNPTIRVYDRGFTLLVSNSGVSLRSAFHTSADPASEHARLTVL